MNTLLISALIIVGNITTAPGKEPHKEQFLAEITKTCYPKQPKEFCDCVKSLADKNFTEDNLKKLMENPDETMLIAAGLTMRMIGIQCATEYQEKHAK